MHVDSFKSLAFFNFFQRTLLVFSLVFKKNQKIDFLLTEKHQIDFLFRTSIKVSKNGEKEIYIEGDRNRSGSYRFYLRRFSSDIEVYKQIYYQPDWPIMIEKVSTVFGGLENVKQIVDGGAYIGLSTLYWTHSFPQAQVIALEAESSNLKLLKRNVELNELKNVTVLHQAVWYRNEDLAIARDKMDKRPWAFAVEESIGDNEKDKVQGRSLFSLVEEYKIDRIDVLKLDVEGAEKQIFLMDDQIGDVLAKTKVVICELHYFDQQRQDIIKVLTDHNFSMECIGEVNFFVNQNLIIHE